MGAPLASTNARRPEGLTSETIALACRVAELMSDARVVDVERYARGSGLVLWVKCFQWHAYEFDVRLDAPNIDAAMRASIATVARDTALWRFAATFVCSDDACRAVARALLRISDDEIRP